MVENFPNLDRFLECVRVLDGEVDGVDDFENENQESEVASIQSENDKGQLLRPRVIQENMKIETNLILSVQAVQFKRVTLGCISCAVLFFVLRFALKRRSNPKTDRKAL